MNDPIKISIQQQREAFDTAWPDKHGWPDLDRVLDRWPIADNLERTLLADRPLFDAATPATHLWENIATQLDSDPTLHSSLTLHSTSDSLEHFIRIRRTDFDLAEPAANGWLQVEQQLAAPQLTARPGGLSWKKALIRAAASIVLVAVGIGLGIKYANHTATTPAGMAMSDVSAEYRELEQFYQRDIGSKQQQLATFTGNQPDEVAGDLIQIDAAMQELRDELARVPAGNREQVVRAMIENYKAKMAILQRVLERLESTKTEQNDHKYHESKRI